MSRSAAEAALEARADLFKALGHPARLLILNLVHARPRHGEELALILRLNPATISHHLALLSTAGLLRAQKDQYYQTYSLVPGKLQATLGSLVLMPESSGAPVVEEDAFRKKVLNTFFQRGRLVSIPAQMKKRLVILEKLVEDFEPLREYSEREVNQVLVAYHDDVASLRRGLIEHGLMRREAGVYRRVEAEKQPPCED